MIKVGNTTNVKRYQNQLKEKGTSYKVSRKGNCLDNAIRKLLSIKIRTVLSKIPAIWKKKAGNKMSI
jgi:hypothetical protein